MRRHVGQAAHGVFRLTRRLLSLVYALLVVALVAVLLLSWRLSEGPIALPWLVRQFETTLNADPAGPRWSIGTAELAWQGFAEGIDRPLDLLVSDITLSARNGTELARLPEARISLATAPLWRGLLLPSGIELRGVDLHLYRAEGRGITLDPGTGTGTGTGPDDPPPLIGADLLAQLTRPVADGPLSELRRIRIRGARLGLIDAPTNTILDAQDIAVDLSRAKDGRIIADASLAVALGAQTVRLTLHTTLRAPAEAIALDVTTSDLNPARLATDLKRFAAAALLDAPVGLEARLTFDPNLAFRQAELRLHAGAGAVTIGRGRLAIQAATAALTLIGDAASLTLAEIDVPTPSGSLTRVTATGAITPAADGHDATADLTFDRIGAVDLGLIWPIGIGGKGTRPWIINNLTAGTARDLRVAVALHAGPGFSAPVVTSLSGRAVAEGVTLHWLKPIPPIEQARGDIIFTSPDIIDFAVSAGRQGGLRLTGGHVRISGLSVRDQVADIEADITGPVAEIIPLLRHPRLRLLDRRPIEMREPSGTASGHLDIIALPLEDYITVDDVRLRATARLSDVHLGAIAAGRDLDHGQLDLTASNDALKVQGTAQLAGIAARLAVEMDFRPGPPSQIIQSVTATATPDGTELAGFGLDPAAVQGAFPTTLVWRSRRNGKGDLAVTADLGATRLALPPLNFIKPAGRPAKLDLHAELERDRIAAIDRLSLRGDGIDAEARIRFADGRPALAVIPRLRLGRDTDLQADITFAPRPDAPWRVILSGASLDATALLRRAPPDPNPGPAYRLEARLDRVILGPGPARLLTGITLKTQSDGRINRELRLAGQAAGQPFALDITPKDGGRILSGSASDAGALLQALDLVADMQGGAMSLTGQFDDSRPDHALTGTAVITDFRMTKAPGLAKLLQAMTFYGLVELVRGPGLGFSRAEAPFTLAEDVLRLDGALAFNASLGMTAKGRLELTSGTCDLTGTIVPAYFFNTLLGRIPILGRLFSAEPGGGLFAANYTLKGPCDDPAVSVNPLSALTPGFLRGIFGIFDGQPDAPKAPPPQPIR